MKYKFNIGEYVYMKRLDRSSPRGTILKRTVGLRFGIIPVKAYILREEDVWVKKGEEEITFLGIGKWRESELENLVEKGERERAEYSLKCHWGT